jgi:uncharacterized membrane protein YkoI
MKRTSIFIFAIALLATGAFAVNSKVTEKANESRLQKLAKISPDSARTLALQRTSGKIIESGLEVENGVLFYSYDIQTKGGKVTEVQINAKDGSIVPAKKETSAKEKAEIKVDDAKMKAVEKEDKASEEAKETASEEASEWVGSIPVKGDTNLAALAKINTEQADSAAVNLRGGTVRETKLANEDGYLVYKVTVDLNGKIYEALVDAGNAKVLEIKSHE